MRLWEIEALSVREGSPPGIASEGQLPGAIANSHSGQKPTFATVHYRWRALRLC
jgi:hypothetical protein